MPELVINGPEGRIEARYQRAASSKAPIALVMPPHPKFGGTMNHKVVYHLFHVFARSGFSVLRFNFRGVGRSQGSFDNGAGELADAAAAPRCTCARRSSSAPRPAISVGVPLAPPPRNALYSSSLLP